MPTAAAPRLLARLARVSALVVDDWLMAPPSEPQRRDFLEIRVERHLLRSTILTSQTPLDRWHAQVGDPVAADSILDRLLHNAHQFELQGESLRKERGRRSLDGTGDESRSSSDRPASSRPGPSSSAPRARSRTGRSSSSPCSACEPAGTTAGSRSGARSWRAGWAAAPPR